MDSKTLNSTIKDMLDQYNVTDQTREFLTAGYQRMYIDGEFTDASDGNTLEIEDPSSGELLLQVPCATTADVDSAINAARNAFENSEWSALTPLERQALLFRMADIMEENAQTLAELESIDAGKAISGCMVVDIMGSINFLRYMAGWATKIDGATRNLSWPGESFGFTLKEPVGVVGAIVPWNWPLNMSMWKMAAPLTVGCTIVLKPAEITPVSILYLMQLWQKAGLPKGVVNIVTGEGRVAGAHLASHPDIDKISFTGSTPVGKLIGKAAVDNMTHATLELGGKSAMLAFNDARIEDIVAGTQQSVFFNTGQVCSAGSRLYVHRSIYQETIDAIVDALSTHVLGDPLAPETTMGPVISRVQFDSIMKYIEIGKNEGANLVYGGNSLDRAGYFIEPTLFTDTRNSMRIVQEEIFGPVLAVQAFDDDDEGMFLANDNIYGLAGSIFTKDVSRAHKMVRRMQAGSVCVNTHDAADFCMPFGGYKMSGIGKDMGREQLDYFLKTKSVIMQL